MFTIGHCYSDSDIPGGSRIPRYSIFVRQVGPTAENCRRALSTIHKFNTFDTRGSSIYNGIQPDEFFPSYHQENMYLHTN